MNTGNVVLVLAQSITLVHIICGPGHKYGEWIGRSWKGLVPMALDTQIQTVNMQDKTLSMGVMDVVNRKEFYERRDGAAVWVE